MNKKIYFAVIAVLALAPSLVLGATFRTGQNYYLDSGATINDNLYAAGGMVGILGTVNGDVITAGGSISISGNVAGDVTAAGGNLNITSNVAGDLRVAGGNIFVSNSVGGDLLVAGGQISVLPGTSVGKDASIAGGVVYIDGTINGNLSVAAEEIKLGPSAVISGDFDYYSKKQATLENGASVSGATNFHKTTVPVAGKAKKAVLLGFLGIAWIVKLITIIVAGLVMIYFFKPQASAIVKKSVLNFWKEALKGFVVLIVVPVAVILSFVTILGSLLGAVVLLAYILFIIIASVVSILLFAKLCLKYLFKKENYELNWWVVAVSALVFSLVSVIPFVGWIFALIIFLSALGSTSDFIYKKVRG